MNRILERAMFRLFANRFVAGENLQDAVETAMACNQKGIGVIINFLGEHIITLKEAISAQATYFTILEAIRENRLNARISLKLSQLGLNIDRDVCFYLVKNIIKEAIRCGVFVEIDMEESGSVEETVNLATRLWGTGFGEHIRVAFQAYLKENERFFETLASERISLRLCKGAYTEPESVAFQDEQMIKQRLRELFEDSVAAFALHPALATHDLEIVNFARNKYHDRKTDFEFQFLRGVRSRLHEQLVKEGWTVYIYLPYGPMKNCWAYGKRRWKFFVRNALSLVWDDIMLFMDKKLKRN